LPDRRIFVSRPESGLQHRGAALTAAVASFADQTVLF
jgi:hypothetical protein